MFKMVNENTATPATLNNAYAEGYRFYCEGNYRTLNTIDHWSGMPNTENDLFFFNDKEEAEGFAKTQTWVFNKNVTAEVYEIPEHTKTWEERKAEVEAKKAEEKAKRAKAEAKKAEALGLTVEEYKKEKARKTKIRKAEKEIARLEKELAEAKAYLAML